MIETYTYKTKSL